MSNKKKDNPDRLLITEMFMAQASPSECFYGSLTRSKDANGIPHLFSRIIVNDGLIMACAPYQKLLGKILDEMCVMYLNGLHLDIGVDITINGDNYYLN